MEKQESLLELGLRDIDDEYLSKNINNIRYFIERLNEKDNRDIFLGIRHKKFTFYYMGRELLSFSFENDKIIIITRTEFENKEQLNKEYEQIMNNIPLIRNHGTTRETCLVRKKGKKYIIEQDDYKKYSKKELISYLFKELKTLLQKYYEKNDHKELPIQGKYCTNYNNMNGNLYIVDMEFTLPKKAFSKLDKKPNGRYDMIAFHNVNGKHKLVFIELKIKKSACINKSGINAHIDDMDGFLMEYNKKDSLLKDMMIRNIKRIIEIKSKLKLIADIKNFDDFDFDNPEFWILLDMENDKKINSIKDIEKMIGESIFLVNKNYLKFYKGNIDNKEIRLLQ